MAWLNGLGKELHDKTYQPGYPLGRVRKVMIPKPGGGERALGIPTIRDRVSTQGTRLFSMTQVYGPWGVLRLRGPLRAAGS
jgi:hypothetical protein